MEPMPRNFGRQNPRAPSFSFPLPPPLPPLFAKIGGEVVIVIDIVSGLDSDVTSQDAHVSSTLLHPSLLPPFLPSSSSLDSNYIRGMTILPAELLKGFIGLEALERTAGEGQSERLRLIRRPSFPPLLPFFFPCWVEGIGSSKEMNEEAAGRLSAVVSRRHSRFPFLLFSSSER